MTESEVMTLLSEYAQRKNIDENFLVTVCRLESRFDPLAESHTGAIGLMQLTTAAIRHYNSVHGTSHIRLNAFDPDLNLTIATWYIGWISDQLGVDPVVMSPKDMARVYAAYNVGLSTVRRLDAGNFSAASRLVSLQAPVLSKDGPEGYLDNVVKYFDRGVV